MSNYAECPNCETEIDAAKAALHRECPECQSTFTELVRQADDYEPPEMESPIDGPRGTQ